MAHIWLKFCFTWQRRYIDLYIISWFTYSMSIPPMDVSLLTKSYFKHNVNIWKITIDILALTIFYTFEYSEPSWKLFEVFVKFSYTHNYIENILQIHVHPPCLLNEPSIKYSCLYFTSYTSLICVMCLSNVYIAQVIEIEWNRT